MRRSLAPVILILLTTVLAQAATTGHGPWCVNDFGNPRALAVEGCKTFTPDTVVAALASNADVVLAAHPAAPLEAYRTVLCERTTAGFQRAGFPYVTVAAKVDSKAEKIRIAIDEGPRYTAGPVLVRGNSRISADELTKVLTSRRPPDGARRVRVHSAHENPVYKWIDNNGNDAEMKDPVWEPGKPAASDPATYQLLQQCTRRALSDQGFFPAFRISLLPQSDGKTASLLIEIMNEGRKAVLGKITITGNKKNTREEILNYLVLCPELPFQPNWQAEIEHRLWRSGRFIKATVTIGELASAGVDYPSTGDNRVPMQIDVVESPWAPRLLEPLSAEQKALLKFRDRLVNPNHWPDDLVLTAQNKSSRLHIVFSPKEGVIGRIEWSAASDSWYPERFDGTFVFTDRLRGVVCHRPARAGMLATVTGTPGSRVLGSLVMDLMEKPDDDGNSRRCLFSAGAKSLAEGESPRPFDLAFEIPPSYIIAMTTLDEDVTCSIREGVLTVISAKERLRVEAETGRLLEWKAVNKQKGETGTAEIKFEQGAFHAAMAKIEEAAARFPNHYDADAPWTSWVGLLCCDGFLDSLKKLDPESRRWLRLVRVTQKKGVLEGPDGLSEIIRPLLPKWSNHDDRFTIPLDSPGWEGTASSTMQYAILYFGLPVVDKVFSRHSWPWTFSRELMLTATQQTKYTSAELERLCISDRTGPVFYLTAATVLDMVNPQAAKMLAQRGLVRLADGDFQKDCRELLLADGAAGRCARRIAQAVRDLEPSEVDAILGPRSDGEPSVLADVIRVLRAEPDRPIDEAILDAMTVAWNAGQREQVKARLASIRDRKDAPAVK